MATTSFQPHCASPRTELSSFPPARFIARVKEFSFSRCSSPSCCALHSSFLPHPSVLTCRSTPTTEPQETEAETSSSNGQVPPDNGDDEADNGGGGAMGSLSSAFIFAFWAGLIAYCAFLAPNQTPVIDKYFLEKLLNPKSDEGFELNLVMTCLWYLMGLWPAIYWMLLIPSGRRVRDPGTLVPGHAILITLQFDASVVSVLCLYASTTASKRAWFCGQIVNVLHPVDLWIVGGDFNNVEVFED
ncbi:hypothetical protein L7F22_018351 [Adiantum nelumboides]|nr:hypothetical protein [Adiantum nelumboides]